MKKALIVVIIVIVVGLIVFSVAREQGIQKERSEIKIKVSKLNRQTNLQQATLEISGMFCVSCATGIEYALKEKEGVVSADVDYDSKIGRVVYDPSKISQKEIITAVKPYTAVIIKNTPFK